MSAFIAATPIRPCLLISSISFLTCASLTGIACEACLGKPLRAISGVRYALWRWGNLIVVIEEM